MAFLRGPGPCIVLVPRRNMADIQFEFPVEYAYFKHIAVRKESLGVTYNAMVGPGELGR